MFDFIEEGYKEGDKVWNILSQQWETIIQIVPNDTYSVQTEENSYTPEGRKLSRDSISTIYPNKFELTIPEEAYEIPLKDKDFVECWNNATAFNRSLRFYDAKNNCTFSGIDGKRKGNKFNNYKRVPMPNWAKSVKDNLGD